MCDEFSSKHWTLKLCKRKVKEAKKKPYEEHSEKDSGRQQKSISNLSGVTILELLNLLKASNFQGKACKINWVFHQFQLLVWQGLPIPELQPWGKQLCTCIRAVCTQLVVTGGGGGELSSKHQEHVLRSLIVASNLRGADYEVGGHLLLLLPLLQGPHPLARVTSKAFKGSVPLSPILLFSSFGSQIWKIRTFNKGNCIYKGNDKDQTYPGKIKS